MVLLFVVCGWREEAVAGVFLRTSLVHSTTYVFLCTRATKVGKIVNPAVCLDRYCRSRKWQLFSQVSCVVLALRTHGGLGLELRD